MSDLVRPVKVQRIFQEGIQVVSLLVDTDWGKAALEIPLGIRYIDDETEKQQYKNALLSVSKAIEEYANMDPSVG